MILIAYLSFLFHRIVVLKLYNYTARMDAETETKKWGDFYDRLKK